MQLSDTSQKLLNIFFRNPDKKFYTNELIRLSGLYPNSVQKSLESLVKQRIVISVKLPKFRFYELNNKYRYLKEIGQIVNKKHGGVTESDEAAFQWVKILNRPTPYSFYCALYISNAKYLKKSMESE